MLIDDVNQAVQYTMDLIGIFAFALSGGILAVRKDFDIIGTVILCEAAGLGGGLFRDLVIGVRPVAFSDLGYFLTPWAAAVIVYFGHRLHRGGTALESRLFDLGDAAALGLFSVTGTIKALSHGFNVPAAVTLGAASAVGGGVLSSLLALEVPPLLRWNTDLYAVPALAGGVVVTLLRAAGLLNAPTACAAALLGFGLRILAQRRRWRTPRSSFWRDPFAGLRLQRTPEPPRESAPPDAGTADEARTAVLPLPESPTLTLRTRHGRPAAAPRRDASRPPDPRLVPRHPAPARPPRERQGALPDRPA
ncbi:trimeric intracellular cation channel family protein [Streptomyces coelicoflavus]|uniref:trimeric intracellular cation channel family protein n=1 Tax=Streptomyces coelicoflavus TaxID=285562 RepID=UPI0036853761